MVSNEEIKRRLELRRRGINPDEGLNKENEVICSKCQAVNLENAKFCISCGNQLNEPQVYTLKINEIKSNSIICPSCGSENKPNSKFCTGCGNNLLETIVDAPEANETEMNSLICPECSFENNQGSKFCISCGNSLEISNESIEDVNSFNTEMNNEKEVYLTIKDGNSHDEKIDDKQEVQLDAESENASDKEMEDILEQPAEVNILDEIKKAKELLDMGAISQEEYEIIKSKYLDLLN